MTNAVDPADTEHRFRRNGQDLRVRVVEVNGDGERGHLLLFGAVADGCLVRVHSRCLYGEALRSQDCDCGPELDKALDLIQAAGSGVLVYLEQEGRGAGLIAKALGYRESERSGADTFASYEALGYPADARTYVTTARALADLGLRSVQLLTNNPAKVQALRQEGLRVTAVPLRTRALSERARDYLETKRTRRKHWIPTDAAPWALDEPGGMSPAADEPPAADPVVITPGENFRPRPGPGPAPDLIGA
ncbi:GTP cyclohydrolase II [Nocardia gamkensis]|uniref:GTP cyclohydrolase II n=1 Tax=Nocardia gamkensis TaxID=352869 RepID=UPI000A042548|nr:GTP cyclohydrolase II [Nocardia gamkensis]NQE71061.1 putative bifunctional riboflavin biosynthesis protein RIBA 2, chloroplastic [Nocardia gamkensis]